MKRFKQLSVTVAALVFGLAFSILAFSGMTSADCFQYNQDGFPTQATPIFNNVCNVPNLGDESNFVRIKQDNNNEEDNIMNDYTTGTLNSDCSNGATFDVINYVHNDAYPADNPDQNPTNPTAVANNVKEDLTAATGNNSQFAFGDTVTASNAATVTKSVNLDCSSSVALSLTNGNGNVKIFSEAYGPGDTGAWEGLGNIVNNGPTPIGSTNAGASSDTSGTQWGCWTYTTMIVYQVTVTRVTPTSPVCTALTPANNDEATVESITVPTDSSAVTGYTVDLYEGSPSNGTLVQSGSTIPFTFTAQLEAGKTYTVVGTLLTSSGSITSPNCQYSFTTPTSTTPPPSSVTPAAVTSLLSTGPSSGEMVGIFAGVTVAGAVIYNWLLHRRLAKK